MPATGPAAAPATAPTLDSTVDAIRAKFGTAAVRRANTLDRPAERADGFTEVRRKD